MSAYQRLRLRSAPKAASAPGVLDRVRCSALPICVGYALAAIEPVELERGDHRPRPWRRIASAETRREIGHDANGRSIRLRRTSIRLAHQRATAFVIRVERSGLTPPGDHTACIAVVVP